MKFKMTKAQENRLKCLCGGCDHTFRSRTCPYNKIIDAKDPSEEQQKLIKAFMRDVFKTNIEKKTCATIKKTKKKGKKNGRRAS